MSDIDELMSTEAQAKGKENLGASTPNVATTDAADPTTRGPIDPAHDTREANVEGGPMMPVKKVSRPAPKPITATREQLLAALAYRISLSMAGMDRLTFAAHRDRLEAALAPCKINPEDIDDLRDDAMAKALDKRHAKILQPFDRWIVEHKKQTHMALLLQVSPDYVRWSARFPDAAITSINSPDDLIFRTLPKSVTKLSIVHNVHNFPALSQSWVEAMRFDGIEIELINVENVKQDTPRPSASQIASAHDTLNRAAMHETKH